MLIDGETDEFSSERLIVRSGKWLVLVVMVESSSSMVILDSFWMNGNIIAVEELTFSMGLCSDGIGGSFGEMCGGD